MDIEASDTARSSHSAMATPSLQLHVVENGRRFGVVTSRWRNNEQSQRYLVVTKLSLHSNHAKYEANSLSVHAECTLQAKRWPLELCQFTKSRTGGPSSVAVLVVLLSQAPVRPALSDTHPSVACRLPGVQQHLNLHSELRSCQEHLSSFLT